MPLPPSPLQLKMLQGELPSTDLLQQHGLTHYLVFREAMQNGDVGLFQRSMQVRWLAALGRLWQHGCVRVCCRANVGWHALTMPAQCFT